MLAILIYVYVYRPEAVVTTLTIYGTRSFRYFCMVGTLVCIRGRWEKKGLIWYTRRGEHRELIKMIVQFWGTLL